MDTLKRAGAMLAHLDLFRQMADLRKLIQLAHHMDERGDRAALIAPESLTLYGPEITTDAGLTTSKGVHLSAADAYRTVQGLKGFESAEYAVTRDELRALNARAVSALEDSDELRAFAETLTRIGVPATPGQTAEPRSDAARSPAPEAPERPSRARRQEQDAPSPETPAA